MKTLIYAKTKGSHNIFFLVMGGKEYYLFTQKYKCRAEEYFHRGVTLDKALDFSRSNRDMGVVKVMKKLPMYIRSLEKEYGITILNSSVRKKAA